jgi:hypothetical protein
MKEAALKFLEYTRYPIAKYSYSHIQNGILRPVVILGET